MTSRATSEKWLHQLTHIPTAPGKEREVVDWVRGWVSRRPDLRLRADGGGNLVITQKGRKQSPPVVAVAHMDHPAFVVVEAEGREVRYEFRGGVNPEYFERARVVFGPSRLPGRVIEHDPATGRGIAILDRASSLDPGVIGFWAFRRRKVAAGRFAAPSCDDLAGVAASLSALDRARADHRLRHFVVLLTRGEEVGFLGAFHAAREGTIPRDARVLSIETSPELPDARLGDGPIIRVGDRLTMYDREMTNLITNAARGSGLKHQRKLMSGGACEATAFGVSGFRSSGLCLALANHHNRGNLAAVAAGNGRAEPMLEEISLKDFHGLVDLILTSVAALDEEDRVFEALDTLFDRNRHYLD